MNQNCDHMNRKWKEERNDYRFDEGQWIWESQFLILRNQHSFNDVRACRRWKGWLSTLFFRLRVWLYRRSADNAVQVLSFYRRRSRKVYRCLKYFFLIQSIKKSKKSQLQGLTLRPFPGLVNFVPVVAYHFCLNLPAAAAEQIVPCYPFISSPSTFGKKALFEMKNQTNEAFWTIRLRRKFLATTYHLFLSQIRVCRSSENADFKE